MSSPQPSARRGAGLTRRRRLTAKRGIALVGALAVVILTMPIVVVQVVGALNVHEVDDVPDRSVALVLGAGLRPGGKPSVYLTRRLDMARQLYEDGKVQAILVSGDNKFKEHDEPTAMFEWLVEAGVPAEHVVRDHAGFDTHDSCVRAHDVFGVRDAIVVTQDYHLPRAVFSCNAAGVDAVGVGVSSKSVARSTAVKYRVREAGASAKAAWDALIKRKPEHGGTETSLTDLLDKKQD